MMSHRVTLRLASAAVCMLCCITTSAIPSHKKQALLLKPSYAQVDSILNVLDQAISHKADYQAQRIAHADSLVISASKKQGADRIMALKEAYCSYSHVSGSKSMEILDQIERLPEYTTDRNLRLWVTDSRGYIYSVMGMFHRSYDLMHEINAEDYDRPARMYHYDTAYKVLSWADQAFCNASPLIAKERDVMKQCNDSLLNYHNDVVSTSFARVAHDIDNHDYDEALKKLIILYQDTYGQEETYVYAHLCDVFQGKKDTLALTYYFAKTSISDIQAGTTEYMCLPMLVQYLFKAGDVDRAYNYLKCCLDDAYLYPSQFLISQTTNIFPIVDKQYQEKKAEFDQTQHNMMILGFFAVLLFVMLITLSVFLHHRQRMLQELKKANDRLAETNKDLAQANKVKDIFLRNMTHELHTPMNAIDGFAQVLDDDSVHFDTASRKEMTTAIRRSSHQLNMLIDNIIMLTEYENTHAEAKKLPVMVDDIFSSLKQQVFNPNAGLVDIVYQNNIPSDFVFLSSKVHIITILLNLIDNSLKFTERGTVTVSASLNEDNNIVLRVADTGPGIPPDRINSLFDRFSALDDFAQGVGISLSLCHTLAKLIGGIIAIDKSDATGTTISLTIM